MTPSTTKWTIEAEIMPKRGVNDPQGEAVLSGLGMLGFDQAGRVRVGKLIRVEVNAESEEQARKLGTRMCDQLLANPIIEEYELTVSEANGTQERG